MPLHLHHWANIVNMVLHIVLVDKTTKKEKIQKNIETGDSRYIYQNKLEKIFNIAKDQKYDVY